MPKAGVRLLFSAISKGLFSKSRAASPALPIKYADRVTQVRHPNRAHPIAMVCCWLLFWLTWQGFDPAVSFS